MSTVVVIVHVVVCLALILIVLLQTGKGAGIGAAFGGGSSQTFFGSAGPSGFLGKITAVAAIVFMMTSLGLSFFASHRVGGDSVMQNLSVPAQEQPAATQTEQPAAPETPKEQAQPIQTAPGDNK